MNAPAVVSRDECVLIDTTADGRVRLTRGGGTVTMSPAVAQVYVAMFDAKGDDESRCIAAALRREVEKIAREVAHGA